MPSVIGAVEDVNALSVPAVKYLLDVAHLSAVSRVVVPAGSNFNVDLSVSAVPTYTSDVSSFVNNAFSSAKFSAVNSYTCAYVRSFLYSAAVVPLVATGAINVYPAVALAALSK